MNLIASSFTSISSISSSLFYLLSSARLPDTIVPFIALFCAVSPPPTPFTLFSFCSHFPFTSSLYLCYVLPLSTIGLSSFLFLYFLHTPLPLIRPYLPSFLFCSLFPFISLCSLCSTFIHFFIIPL